MSGQDVLLTPPTGSFFPLACHAGKDDLQTMATLKDEVGVESFLNDLNGRQSSQNGEPTVIQCPLVLDGKAYGEVMRLQASLNTCAFCGCNKKDWAEV